MRRYSKDHTWVAAEGTHARIGISEFAQGELGDIAYVELPSVGRQVQRGEVACTVDSLKSSSEIYAPLTGSIVEVNSALAGEESYVLVNRDPLGEGWLFAMEMTYPAELDLLLGEEEYAAYVRGE